jgi:2-polyprenyl-6-methoxyphenol hydroxylase-like FAD-dependent oxidoreductase
MSASRRRLHTRCCIVGGGPAGMMLGLLLARGGVEVMVLEKHADFLRDFRGDTVHPSTLAILDQLGLLQAFQKLPQRREEQIFVHFADRDLPLGDFRGLSPFPYMTLAAQWDFLDLLADAARNCPSFKLHMSTEVTALERDEAGRVCGVLAREAAGELVIDADLVIACDGRNSILRADSHLTVDTFGAPMDVLWFRLPRPSSDPDHTYGAPARGRMLVMLNRNDYWQCAYLIRKGSGDTMRAQPLQAFRDLVAPLLPFEPARMDAVDTWDAVKLLEVRVDRLRNWHSPGLLLIGDAAHAMSPIGGVGINLAIQDAVATSNLLGPALRDTGAIDDRLLSRVQQRRRWPTLVIQSIQKIAQQRVIADLLKDAPGGLLPTPPILRWLSRCVWFRHLPARLFGFGLRRERVTFPHLPQTHNSSRGA